jgi:hypothetical protein
VYLKKIILQKYFFKIILIKICRNLGFSSSLLSQAPELNLEKIRVGQTVPNLSPINEKWAHLASK